MSGEDTRVVGGGKLEYGSLLPEPSSFADNFMHKFGMYIEQSSLKVNLEAFYVYIGYPTDFAVTEVYRKNGISLNGSLK